MKNQYLIIILANQILRKSNFIYILNLKSFTPYRFNYSLLKVILTMNPKILILYKGHGRNQSRTQGMFVYMELSL